MCRIVVCKSSRIRERAQKSQLNAFASPTGWTWNPTTFDLVELEIREPISGGRQRYGILVSAR